MMTGSLKVHEGKCVVTRSLYGVETETVETVEVPLFHTAPAYVEVKGGITKNLGNYESARIDVKVSLPSYPVISEMERAYQIAASFVEQKIGEQNAEINQQLAGVQAQRPL